MTIQRWSIHVQDVKATPQEDDSSGQWVRYVDHVAACERLRARVPDPDDLRCVLDYIKRCKWLLNRYEGSYEYGRVYNAMQPLSRLLDVLEAERVIPTETQRLVAALEKAARAMEVNERGDPDPEGGIA